MSNLNHSGEIGNEDISYQVRQNLPLFLQITCFNIMLKVCQRP